MFIFYKNYTFIFNYKDENYIFGKLKEMMIYKYIILLIYKILFGYFEGKDLCYI